MYNRPYAQTPKHLINLESYLACNSSMTVAAATAAFWVPSLRKMKLAEVRRFLDEATQRLELAEAECRAETPEDMATDALRAEMEG